MYPASQNERSKTVAIIGGGPSGLMAAEVLANAGCSVDVYEAMPTLGRKFLRAGLGGLNITHSEPFEKFCTRYTDRQQEMQAFLERFTPAALQEWVHELGISTFIGSSGRIFPKEMKSAPLLRIWVQRLRRTGVRFHMKHRWIGFEGRALKITAPDHELIIEADAAILALGGASWPQLGSDGAWVPWLEERGIKIAPWQSANCGFDLSWSEHLLKKYSGAPLKSVALSFTNLDGVTNSKRGELLIANYGVEGSLIYAFSREIRDYINVHGKATFYLDLYPDRSTARLLADLARPRGSRSLSRHLQACLGKDDLKRALLFEFLDREQMKAPSKLAAFAKALPVTVRSTRPLCEAISSSGGVRFESLDSKLMLRDLPGVFVAGEMIDWEAPTGGYLLTGCLATGFCAGQAVLDWLTGSPEQD